MEANNKLIAEFMGNKTIRINVPFEYDLGEKLPTSGNICNSVVDAMEEVQTEVDNGIISGCDLCMEALEYHRSWDWLMPVVAKCTELNDDEFDNQSIAWALLSNSIVDVYDQVVRFISEYNQNN